MDRDEILRVLRALERAGVDYALIGAAAMGMHGIVRATEDMDLLIRADRENVERIQSALRAVYQDDPCLEEIQAGELLGDFPVVRYSPQGSDLCFGLITKLGEMATFEAVESEIKEIQGVCVRVATAAALLLLKREAVRPIDRQDAEALGQRFDSKENGWTGVQRFSSLEEMNATQLRHRTSDGFERFIRHNARIRALSSRSTPMGVFRFRSLMDAQRARQASYSVPDRP